MYFLFQKGRRGGSVFRRKFLLGSGTDTLYRNSRGFFRMDRRFFHTVN